MKSMYWAGPRCFVASMRHFDLETIKILENDYSWVIYYPPRLVAETHSKFPEKPLYGRNGLIRKTCLDFIEKSSIIVAYVGLIWDSGTARETEHALNKGKPILAWSDSSVFYGETLGRRISIDGCDMDPLYASALPLNAMDVIFDRYLEISELYNDGLTEQELAMELNQSAREILHLKSK